MFKRECDSLFLVKVLFVLAIGLLTISCGTTKMYSGPELPANEVAFIRSATSAVEAGHKYSVDWKTDLSNSEKYVVVLKDRKTGE